MKFAFLCLLTTLVIAPGFASDASQLDNADLRIVTAKRDAEQHLHQILSEIDNGEWFAYAVDSVPGHAPICCPDGCSLSKGYWTTNEEELKNRSDRMMLLFRVKNNRINKVRMFSTQCPIDAEGAVVHWIEGIDSGSSLAFLAEQVSGKQTESIIAAMALHGDEAAADQLESWARGDQFEKAKASIFWLANSWEGRGYDVISDLAINARSAKIREHVTFGLHISKQPGALDLLKKMAREDEHSQVRGQALFWMAQTGGDGVAEAILEMLEEDPSENVSEKAVFALSQLPDGEGAPILERLVREHDNDQIRGKALFWISQSDEPTAIKLIEHILADDASAHLQEKAVFSLSQLSEGTAVDRLIKLAESHERQSIRGKALFWLAQKAGDRVTAHLEKAVHEDPSHEVREQAIFALSQSGDKGIDALIEVANNHDDMRLRKKALFWLGQSNDPRALDVIKAALD